LVPNFGDNSLMTLGDAGALAGQSGGGGSGCCWIAALFFANPPLSPAKLLLLLMGGCCWPAVVEPVNVNGADEGVAGW
jgi:hypothetical protein